jgi:hypothetical protein
MWRLVALATASSLSLLSTQAATQSVTASASAVAAVVRAGSRRSEENTPEYVQTSQGPWWSDYSRRSKSSASHGHLKSLTEQIGLPSDVDEAAPWWKDSSKGRHRRHLSLADNSVFSNRHSNFPAGINPRQLALAAPALLLLGSSAARNLSKSSAARKPRETPKRHKPTQKAAPAGAVSKKKTPQTSMKPVAARRQTSRPRLQAAAVLLAAAGILVGTRELKVRASSTSCSH